MAVGLRAGGSDLAWCVSVLPYRLRHVLLSITGIATAGLDVDPTQRGRVGVDTLIEAARIQRSIWRHYQQLMMS